MVSPAHSTKPFFGTVSTFCSLRMLDRSAVMTAFRTTLFLILDAVPNSDFSILTASHKFPVMW